MFLTNNASIQEVLFFPQMKPEKLGEKKGPDLTKRKIIMDILEVERTMDLNDLKEKTGLSNKKWDKEIKTLGKLGVTKVTKTDDNLIFDFTGE